MRHTSMHRNNRMRLQKIGKKLAQKAKQLKKEQRSKAADLKPASKVETAT